MLKSLMLMSAVAIAAPAMAQTATPPAAPASTNAAQPVTDQPTTPSTTAEPVAAATPAQPAEPVANPADAVAAVVASDWGTYDADTNGNLSKVEFGKWMVALREKNATADQPKIPDVKAWTDAAFAKVDTDKSGSVSKPELEVFLKG